MWGESEKNIFILSSDTCFWLACYIDDLENYKKIYELKDRDFSKWLAVLIDDFEFFEENKIFNKKQIDFLKNYENPFTILINTKKLEKIKDKNSNLKKILETVKKLPNKEIYEKIAFRVAQTFMQRKLIRLGGFLFLTSANKSGNSEIFSSVKVKEEFEKDLEKFNIKILAHNEFCINSKQKSSDIFEFEGESLELKYLRKN